MFLSGLSVGEGRLGEHESASADMRSSMFIGYNPFIFNTSEAIQTTVASDKLDRKVADYDNRYASKVKTNVLHSSSISRERSAAAAVGNNQSVDNVIGSNHNRMESDNLDGDIHNELTTRKSAHFSYDHYNL